VLALQLALAIVLWFAGTDNTAFKAKDPLLAFDPAKVDRIEIAESGANSVALVKEGGNWTIPSLAGFPADGAKVNGLLTKLAGLKKGWPVASSSESARRFKVSDDSFEHKIVLKSGGKEIGEILLGTSPSFKQISARAGDDGHVYSVAFAAYEAGGRGEEWMDRSLVNTHTDQIASIAIGDVTLERKDGKFVLDGLAEGQKPNETAIYRLVGALTYPAFDAVAGKGPEALAKVNGPDIEATLKRTSGAPVVLKYKKEAAGGAYLFASSANDFLFRASEAAVEPIVKAKREALIEAPKKAETPAAQAVAATPAEPKKAEDQASGPAKPSEAKGAEAQPAEGAPPSKPEAAAKAEGQAAETPPPSKSEEPNKAQDEGAETATHADKPEEAQPKGGG
jgi:Domain of unknown function (DUF4340)